MSKNRLFVFGDSWAYNYFSNEINKLYPDFKPFLGQKPVELYVKNYDYFGHWIDHMNNFFNVTSYGLGGFSNEQIIWSLSNLPKYENGDRIIIIFTGVERYTWVHNKRRYAFAGENNLDRIIGEPCTNIFKEQYNERYTFWMDDDINNDEKKFLNIFPSFYEKYNPVVVTWRQDLSEKVKSIDLIDFKNNNLTTIMEESNGTYNDNHLGVNGNFELFKFLSNKLNLSIDSYDFYPKKFKKKLV